MTPKYTFHFIGNSHLDPVWLWDWREGLSEGLITIRTILELMEEFPKLTYTRGEAAIYEHVEKYDLESFRKIKKYIKQGRWDVVGGTYIQPDTNMTGTEVMARHFAYGQRYFAEHLNVVPRVAWAADSFGHSAGLPTIYAQAGIKYYAFFRPPQSQFKLTSPAFWWHGRDNSRILAYRPLGPWYGCERDELPRRLDFYLQEVAKYPFRNTAVFYGLGNHGGGPSRRHLREIEEWLKLHPEVEGIHSGLHRFFEAFERESRFHRMEAIPDIKQELNFTMRGTYSTGAKFKYRYRQAEARLLRAERTQSALGAGVNAKPTDLQSAWRGLLFNSFHDILPATCTERALNEQITWVESVIHTSEAAEFEALTFLGSQIDCPRKKIIADHPAPVSVLAWNSHPHAYRGPLEIEAALDYRPIFKYQKKLDEFGVEVRDAKGRLVPFQSIRVEHNFMSDLPWRYRVVFDAELPALGWSTYTIGWVQPPQVAPVSNKGVKAPSEGIITDGHYVVTARKGDSGIQVTLDGKPFLTGNGLGLQTVEDAFGPWGNHYEETAAEDLSTVVEEWQVTDTITLESGPLRTALWVRLEAGKSKAEFIVQLHGGRGVIDVRARVFWNEPRRRLKLVMPGVGTRAEYEVPGGTAHRGSVGEVPGWRWARTIDSKRPFGFASDALYNFDLKDDTLRATVVRSSRHAMDVRDTETVPEFIPVIDSGEYKFRFLLTSNTENLPRLAEELEAPPITLPIAPKKGKLPRSKSLAAIKNENLHLLAIKPATDGKGWIIRIQEIAGKKTVPKLEWLGEKLSLAPVNSYAIATYYLKKAGGKWKASAVVLREI